MEFMYILNYKFDFCFCMPQRIYKAHQIQQTTPNLESEFSQKNLPIKLGQKSKKSSLFIYKALERLLST